MLGVNPVSGVCVHVCVCVCAHTCVHVCERERMCVCVIISKQCKEASYSSVHVHGKYCCGVDLFLG